MGVDTLQTLKSHTDALKQGKQDSHHFMFAAVLAMQLNVCVTTVRVAFTIDLHLIGNSVQ